MSYYNKMMLRNNRSNTKKFISNKNPIEQTISKNFDNNDTEYSKKHIPETKFNPIGNASVSRNFRFSEKKSKTDPLGESKIDPLGESKTDPQGETKEKLPLKSISGRRCLSKCYPKGATYLHPVLLTGVADNANNSCAIDPVHSKDPQYYREHDMILADKCRLDDNNIYQLPDELESMLLGFYFNPSDFLASIYGLHSFDQVIYWTLENDHFPFDTVKRVHNCAWKVFGYKIEELSTTVLEYYFDIAKTHWLKDYANIIQNKYSFELTTKEKNNFSDTSDISETYDIIYSKFFTYDFFVSTLKRYVYEYQDKWELFESHYGRIKKYILYQLIEHIESENNKNKSV